ncbi:MAG: hypothetical protein ACRECU_08715, partial [Methylocella sp.]
RGTAGVGRGELTAHPGSLLRRHPSPIVQIDCVVRQNLPRLSELRPGELNTQLTQPFIHQYALPGAALSGFDH